MEATMNTAERNEYRAKLIEQNPLLREEFERLSDDELFMLRKLTGDQKPDDSMRLNN